jgi:hypothetical protein
MRRGLAFALVLAGALTLMSRAADAWNSSVVVVPRGGTVVVVERPFVHHRPFVRPFVASPFVVFPFFAPAPVIVPRPVFVPGFWSWNGLSWVWVPGHWAR